MAQQTGSISFEATNAFSSYASGEYAAKETAAALQTAIEQNAEAITLRATKTELDKETSQRKGTYAECTTAAATANKVATISPAVSDFELYPGVTITVCFTAGNSVASPKLNVNGTGLYPIVVTGSATPALDAVKWNAYTTAMFTFDIRNQWRLVSTDEDVRRLTTAETKIEQNSEAITLRATKTEAQQMAQPNLSPWFSLQPIENDAEHWNINNGNTTFTPLEDGWVHLHNDNSSGTGVKRTDYQVMGSPSVTPGADYTWLFEYRNNNSTGNNQNYIVQSSERVQFWGNNVVKVLEGKSGGATTTLGPNQDFPPGTDGVYVKRVLKKAEATTSSHLDRTGTLYLGCLVCYAYAGAVADYDLRVSVYEGEYSGPYKPYSGSQLYASQAELKVANDAIALKVSKNDVINQINVSTEGATIAANRVNVEGATIFTSGRLSQSSLDEKYDVVMGGRNLLWNTAALPLNWATSKCTITKGQADPFGGTKAVLVTPSAGDHYFVYRWTNHGMPKHPANGYGGGDFTFSVWLKAASTASVALNMHSANSGKHMVTFNVTGSWKRYEVTGTVADAITNADVVWVGQAGTDAYYVAYPKMELGNRASDWSPAPEDQTAYVDSISIGGRNLLVGSSTGDGWRYTAFDAQTVEYTRGTTAVGESYVYGQPMTFEPGQEYTLSCYAKSNGYVKNLDLYKVHQSGGGSHQQKQGIDLTTEYQKVVWTFTCNATEAETAYIRFDNNGTKESGTNAILYIKQPKLEKGNKATDWTPAPEDIEANAVKRTQRIYYRSDSATKPATPSAWVTKEDDGTGAWTKMHVAITSTHKYIYTCEQSEKADGTLGCTTVLRDNTITVIDGGNIITHSIDADAINVESIKIGDLGGEIGGTNLLRRTGTPFDYAINTTNYGTHHLYSTGSTDTAYDGPTLEELGFEVGDEVTLTFDWKTSQNGSTAIRYGNFRIEFYGVTSSGTNGYITRMGDVVTMSESNASGRFSRTATLTAATIKTQRMVVRIDNSALVFTVSRAKLERGDRATDWSPAPEDVSQMVKIDAASRAFTTAQWKTYGAVGHSENWTTGSSYDNSHIHVGDTAYLVGTVTDGVKGTATIIGTVTAVNGTNGTTSVTMSSTQLIFGGDSVDAAAKTATTYLTEGTGGGLMVHRSNDATTGVRITDSVEILQNGTGVAEYGATARIGEAAKAHVKIEEATVKVNGGDVTFVSLAPQYYSGGEFTGGGVITLRSDAGESTYLYSNGVSAQGQEAFSIHAVRDTSVVDDYFAAELFVGVGAGNNALVLRVSKRTGSDTSQTDTIFEVDPHGAVEFATPLADSNLPTKGSAGTAGTSSATSGATLAVPYVTTDAYGRVTAKGTHTHTIGSLAASAVSSGTFDAARIPNLDASKVNSGTFDAARLPTVPIDKGGTGQTGVTSYGVDQILTVESGVTATWVTLTKWGKICQLTLTVSPSEAKTAPWKAATVAAGYRPISLTTTRPYNTSVQAAELTSAGVINVTACTAGASIPMSFTYLLPN